MMPSIPDASGSGAGNRKRMYAAVLSGIVIIVCAILGIDAATVVPVVM